jgi:2-octaprenyl-6-methoxyphenol hydroxylase
MPARLHSMQVHEQEARLEVEQDGRIVPLAARVVVAADGAQSMVRGVAGLGATVAEYGQVAIVAALRTDQRNDGVAYERFTSAGPMALLPLRTPQGESWRTLVWAAEPHDAGRLLQLPDGEFLREWQQAFGWRAGRALAVGTRGRYPLALTRSSGSVAPRVVLLGNAAQSLHPVAGQGFNLALRDVAVLAEMLAGANGADIGSLAWLSGFAGGRDADRDGVVGFTDTLVRVFGSRHPAVVAARDAGLLLFDLLPPAKRALSRVSLGFGGHAPRLTRGLAPGATR